jgi:hypothetical protein
MPSIVSAWTPTLRLNPQSEAWPHLPDVIVNLLAHRIGVFVLGLLIGGRFKGETGFAWGWAVSMGCLR